MYSKLFLLQDEKFQAKVSKKLLKPIDESAPAWKPMQRGIALNHDNLKDFLELDYAEILLNTFINKGEIKKNVEGLVSYLCSKKEEIIPMLFQEYKKSSKKDMTQSLKTVAADYITEHPDLDIIRVSRELPIIFSLLFPKKEGYLGVF